MFQAMTTLDIKLKFHVNCEKYAALIASLSQEYERRFQDFRTHQLCFSIFVTPFTVGINTLTANLQIECVEL
ncbi:hypothetical protein J437_LFUL013888 [Ladona fulva]|uniref:Uncharacterized protein n=1 Tax=Ladona fulva TaxID=123851 RepID=A0A8K0KRH3_LADFU|nr:hypothetical protein J437_LFUL013888 [Ladona fulva]